MSREYVLQPFRSGLQFQIDYAKELNEQQHAAVTAVPGPALVIAGAGSGKTRTLTYRVAYLLEQGIPPENILLLTFTNKAAKEMMRRVADLIGAELNNLWGGTFHSIAARVLRRHAPLLGFEQDFSILDREDSKEMLQACLAELSNTVKTEHFPKADVLSDIFSLCVNKEKSVTTLLAEEFDYFSEIAPQIEGLQTAYAARKKAANGMDFDDLLCFWLKLLREHASVRQQFENRFQFVLVDEYQDTNKIQGDIIDLIAARFKNVMVVGDDSQSIYSWRGAHFLNILKFPERYPNTVTYRIETNYRSTPEILALANASISANIHQFKKELVAARPAGIKPAKVLCEDTRQQAAFVCQRILDLREEGRSLNEVAVLYRSHFHALELQLEMTRRNIPFSITSGIRFFEQAHIKDIAAYLKLIQNPHDELAFKRIIRLLPGIGMKGADKLWLNYSSNLKTESLAVTLQSIVGSVPKKTTVDWAQLTATISQLEAPEIRASASRMIHLIMDAGYQEHLQEEYSNYRNREEDIEQLASFALQFTSVEDFLTQLALQTAIEAEASVKVGEDEDQVRLSTIHQAKGLEFGVVFLIMLCEGSFPSSRSIDSPESEEEERRLFYVSITRAKDELYLTHPMRRSTTWDSGDVMQLPSRFLSELPAELMEEWNLRPPTSNYY